MTMVVCIVVRLTLMSDCVLMFVINNMVDTYTYVKPFCHTCGCT